MEKSISLFYKEGTSDKVYQISSEKSGNGFVVNFAFGRRGDTLKTGTKTSSPVSSEEAVKVFDSLMKEKMKKGYRPIEGDNETANAYITQNDAVDTGIYCQLLNAIEEEQLESYLVNKDYVAQEKHDGQRKLVKKIGAELTVINRKGLKTGYPQPFEYFLTLKDDFVIDGEAVGEKLFVFDIIEHNGKDLKKLPFEERFELLKKVLKKKNDAFEISEVASTAVEKRALYKDLKANGKEGIVFKKKDSHYAAGRPASGGNQIKFKFVDSASFIVTKINAKRSVAVAVLDNGKLVPVGNVTIYPDFDLPKVDDVVEVQYLYAYRNGSIYQPVYQGIRNDIDKKDCTIDQLKYKNEAEVEEA